MEESICQAAALADHDDEIHDIERPRAAVGEVEIPPPSAGEHQDDEISMITDMQTVQYEIYNNSVYPSPAEVLHHTRSCDNNLIDDDDLCNDSADPISTSTAATAAQSGLYPPTSSVCDNHDAEQREAVIHKLAQELPPPACLRDNKDAKPGAPTSTTTKTKTKDLPPQQQPKQQQQRKPDPTADSKHAKAEPSLSSTGGKDHSTNSAADDAASFFSSVHGSVEGLPSPTSSSHHSPLRSSGRSTTPGAFASNERPHPMPQQQSSSSRRLRQNSSSSSSASDDSGGCDGDGVVLVQAELAPENYEEIVAERDALRQTIDSLQRQQQQAKVSVVIPDVEKDQHNNPQARRSRRVMMMGVAVIVSFLVIITILLTTADNSNNEPEMGNNSVAEPSDVTLASSSSTNATTNSSSWGSSSSSSSSHYWKSRQIGQSILGWHEFGEFGEFLSINHNGTLLAIGGEEMGVEFAGQVAVYQLQRQVQGPDDNKERAKWKQLFYIAGDTPGEESGRLALSSQGNRLAIGGMRASATIQQEQTGRVRTYDLLESSSSTFEQQQQHQYYHQIPQIMEGRHTHERFGADVQFNANGTIMAVGSPGTRLINRTDDNTTTVVGMEYGAVRVFRYTTTTTTTSGNETTRWVPMGQELNGDHESDFLGFITALSADGTILAAGGYGSDANGNRAGIVRVFKFHNSDSDNNNDNGGTWKQLGQDFYGQEAGDEIGRSIALSSDGQIISFGGFRHNNSTGRVYVYQWNEDDHGSDGGGMWKPLGQSIDGTKPGDRFGRSVALSGDGSILACSAYWNDDGGGRAGHVRVFHWNAVNTTWMQVGPPIRGSTGDWLGRRISMSRDGSTLAIGSPFHDGAPGANSGRVDVYSLRS